MPNKPIDPPMRYKKCKNPECSNYIVVQRGIHRCLDCYQKYKESKWVFNPRLLLDDDE